MGAPVIEVFNPRLNNLENKKMKKGIHTIKKFNFIVKNNFKYKK